jgi:hypothetical protein
MRAAVERQKEHRVIRDEEEQTPTPVAVSLRGVELPAPVSTREPARPHGARRLVVGFAALSLFVGGTLATTGAPRASAEPESASHVSWASIAAMTHAVVSPAAAPAPAAEPAPEPRKPEPPPAPRADAKLNRTGYGHVQGGVVFVPNTFSSADGKYDLYLHFHGNTKVVLESAEHAGLNAIVAVVNLGVNSAPYLDAYEAPGSYEKILGDVGRVLSERGLDKAQMRRLAVGSWSGGYGAISRIFEQDRRIQNLDAVLVLDGIHCGYLDENPKALNVGIISPFLKGAKLAAEGRFLFSITHSEIEPEGYAGTYATAGYLLDAVHGTRGAPQPAPEHVQLKAAEGAVSKKLEKRMEPISEARVGSFHVRGYRGNTPEHHMAHLLQMAGTVMPELAERWREPSR